MKVGLSLLPMKHVLLLLSLALRSSPSDGGPWVFRRVMAGILVHK
jgi:hypothetical protein